MKKPWSDWTTCEECGKRLYRDRAIAKRVAREALKRAGGKKMREYECPAGRPGYHLGHLPGDVRRGIRSADQHYQRGFGRPETA